MLTSVTGFPRIGGKRELKFAAEKYFNKEISADILLAQAAKLRETHWKKQKENGIDLIASNDFSFYDSLLDASFMLNLIPERYEKLNLGALDKYFAMARGYQDGEKDVKALPMKKWFNTNYHYIAPEISDDCAIKLNAEKIIGEFKQSEALGIKTKPVITGPFTFLKLARFTGKKKAADFAEAFINAYSALIKELEAAGAQWLQIDEPALVTDLSGEETAFFVSMYSKILRSKKSIKVLCQTYFGDIRDCYGSVIKLDFDAIGLDFAEGKEQNLSLIQEYGFPEDKILFAGIINGKNIWRCRYKSALDTVNALKQYAANIAIGTSCSLLHVPFTLENETKIDDFRKSYLSFAYEKLTELKELGSLCESANVSDESAYKENEKLFSRKRYEPDGKTQERVKNLLPKDFTRLPSFEERAKIQKNVLNLPLLPTTTIGSFPQTEEVRKNRKAFKKGEITEREYIAFNKKKIAECVKLQEDIGLDVLVHGEFERNDMVEYFGENLDGFLFTENAWVQSYGTRCVKPPVIWGDISRKKPFTADYLSYAQSLTRKFVKGMLTGPVTILNWSFPREDIDLKESALQIALAIRDEVLDLEKSGLRIIQIDEAALREKLPLREKERHPLYLDWAIAAFRLVHSKVKPETQIHTHMCYSEFSDIIKDIDAMDADVITFEASRSYLSVVDALKENNFKTAVGPGVYDIHSPRVPSAQEIEKALRLMLQKIPKEKLWVNPDCGLKTRALPETEKSLRNLVSAAAKVRGEE